MAGKDDLARSVIARRVGEHLATPGLGDVERQAAEVLAKVLVADTVEAVRCELSKSIRHAKYLPRDIALKIAHDVDSVACPFLEVTEVFSESDWQQLILTISRGAMAAVARRPTMSEGLAVSLVELGDVVVVETLVENRAAPMTTRVCGTVIDRFAHAPSVLDKLAQRDDLLAEIVVKLTTKVSAAAREKLLRNYQMPDHTEVIGAEAEVGALLKVVKQTRPAGMTALVRTLRTEGKLTDLFLVSAAGENLMDFLAAAMADRAAIRLEQARNVLLHAGHKGVIELLRQAGFPDVLHDRFWTALTYARNKKDWSIH